MIWRPQKLTRQQLEERRMEAVRRFQQEGHIQDEIARDLGVSKSTVSVWKKRWKAQGEAGLKATKRYNFSAGFGGTRNSVFSMRWAVHLCL